MRAPPPATLYGCDFTSAPRPRKPITIAACSLEDGTLHLRALDALPDFASFEAFLRHPGPWLAALDFPFGLPRRFLRAFDWPQNWEEYVALIAALGKQGFEETVHRYRREQPVGEKLPLRVCDRLAGAISPLMLHRVPVGKMFFQGAPRLLASGASILPCRPTDANRFVFEGYPGLVARRWLGRRSYKSDERKKQTAAQREARRELLQALQSEEARAYYGLELHVPTELVPELLDDPNGDRLDALLCALQAGWAAQRGEQGYGIPSEVDEVEGWIVDPATSTHSSPSRQTS